MEGSRASGGNGIVGASDRRITQSGRSIKIQGSKNGVLPVMAASLLHNGTTVLEHVPKIQDVFCMMGILNAMGGRMPAGGTTLPDASADPASADSRRVLAGQMRSSVMLLGPLLATLAGEDQSARWLPHWETPGGPAFIWA